MGVTTSKKKNASSSLRLADVGQQLVPESETFQHKLRLAVFGGVSEQDVADVVRQLTERAKQGDPKAVAMFFNYIVGTQKEPPKIILQNNFNGDVEQSARAAKAIGLPLAGSVNDDED